MKCPSCCEALQRANRKGIVIDYCPACRGLWLQSSQLDRILERTFEYEAPPPGTVGFGFANDPPLRPGQPATYGRYHGERTRRHPLRELFDVFE